MKQSYPYTHLEDYLYNLYSNIDIFHPRQLGIEMIAERLGLAVDYLPVDSFHAGDTIILDSRLSDSEQWQDFGHELCHAVWHTGNQLNIPPLLKEYQEWKANNFADHACVPTFMLNKIDLPTSESKAIYKIQETFHVEYNFAKKRLYQYLQNYRSIG